MQVTVSPELSAMLAVPAARSTVVPPEGSLHVRAVSVCGCPGAVPASASRYVPSARSDTVREVPDVPSLNVCPTPE